MNREHAVDRIVHHRNGGKIADEQLGGSTMLAEMPLRVEEPREREIERVHARPRAQVLEDRHEARRLAGAGIEKARDAEPIEQHAELAADLRAMRMERRAL